MPICASLLVFIVFQVDGKTEKARRAKNKRLAVTVMEVKPLFPEGQEENTGDNTGWEVTVRVTASDVTTIVFKVRQLLMKICFNIRFELVSRSSVSDKKTKRPPS